MLPLEINRRFRSWHLTWKIHIDTGLNGGTTKNTTMRTKIALTRPSFHFQITDTGEQRTSNLRSRDFTWPPPLPTCTHASTRFLPPWTHVSSVYLSHRMHFLFTLSHIALSDAATVRSNFFLNWYPILDHGCPKQRIICLSSRMPTSRERPVSVHGCLREENFLSQIPDAHVQEIPLSVHRCPRAEKFHSQIKQITDAHDRDVTLLDLGCLRAKNFQFQFTSAYEQRTFTLRSGWTRSENLLSLIPDVHEQRTATLWYLRLTFLLIIYDWLFHHLGNNR